jgi:sec-independent protein translocase protein TatA
MMFGIGAPELIVILVVALVIFGPGRLPEIGGALGKGIRDFRKSLESKDTDVLPDQKDGDGPTQ